MQIQGEIITKPNNKVYTYYIHTGIYHTWKPVMVLGRPACPTVSTASPTRTVADTGFRLASTVVRYLVYMYDIAVYIH